MEDTIRSTQEPSLTVEGPESGKPVALTSEATIGREPSCTIVLADGQTSRLHARVYRDVHGYQVEDLKSRNGTVVNGVKISVPVRLRDGDIILVGKTSIRFAGSSAPEPAPPATEGHEIVRTLVVDQGFANATEEDIKAAFPRLQALYAVMEAVSSLEDEQEVGQVVLRQLFKLISASTGAIMLREPTAEWKPLCALERDGTPDPGVKVSKTLLSYVVQNRVALITSDAVNDPRLADSGEAPASVYRLQIRSAVSVPLLVKGRVLGVLQLLFDVPGQLVPEDDVRLLTVVAHQTAVAIESARLHRERKNMISELLGAQQELQARVEHLRILNQIERSLSRDDDVTQFLDGIVGEAVRLLSASGGAMLLTREPGESATVAHLVGDRALGEKLYGGALGKQIVEAALTTGQVQRVHPNLADMTVPDASPGIVSVIAVAITGVIDGKEQALGVLELHNKTTGSFTAADADLIAFLAAQISTAMHRKQLLVEKAKAERLSSLGAVAGSIMHDIRNPLTRIRGFAELCARPGVPPESLSKYSRHITSAVDRCSNMAGEILRFVRGETSLELEVVPAGEFFDDILVLLENDIQSANLNLEKAIEYQGPLMIDPDKMNRVIYNLTNNAVRILEPGGTLTLSCRPVGDEVEIRVADTGPGIPAELRPRLFQPFATMGGPGGTGLGLSIVKSIVESHGGRIALDDSVEKGACFVIHLKAPPSQDA